MARHSDPPADPDVEPDPDVADALDRAVAELYGAPPADFVTVRSRHAKEAKAAGLADAATRISALRKPSLAAWAVNVAVRERPEVIDEVLEVGERLRSAQTRLDAAALRTLRTEREQALVLFTRTVGEVAGEHGQRLTQTLLTEVRDTAVAALSSAPAADALGSGTLTRALSYSGFGDVDLADAVAHTATGVRLAVIRGGRADEVSSARPQTREPRSGRTGSAEADAADAAAAAARAERHEQERREGARREAQFTLARARRELDAASSRLDEARAASDRARERVAAARRELAEAEADDEARLLEVSDAVRARKQAQTAVDSAADTLRELQDGD